RVSPPPTRMATGTSTRPSTRPPRADRSNSKSRLCDGPRAARAARGSFYCPAPRKITPGGARPMDESLEKGLLDMEARDRALRAELATAGELKDRYHPRLEELHRANASRLRQIIAVFGWPGFTLVGEKGAQAAWRIALHSKAEPAFMRQ